MEAETRPPTKVAVSSSSQMNSSESVATSMVTSVALRSAIR